MNNWTGTGNLVRDPELSYTQGNQTAKCTFTIACNRPKRNGEDQGADYIRIVTWGRRAETCNNYLSKGRKVGVKGPIHTGSYKDRNGNTVYTTDVWADEVEFMDSGNRPQQQAAPAQPQQNYYDNTTAGNPRKSPESRTVEPTMESQMGFDDLPDSFAAADDDIPF